MKISVIMAAYNSQATIGRAIETFLEQSYADKELVVIDGASGDETCTIVRSYDSPLIHLFSEPDTGIYDALNKGIMQASGQVIGVLHTDDLFARNDVLARIATAFDQDNAGGVYGDLEYVNREKPDRVIRYWRAGSYRPELLAKGWMPPHPTLFLHRRVFETCGAYDTGFSISADYEAILRWLTRADLRLSYIPAVLVRMRVGGESNRSLARVLKKSQEDLRAIRRHEIGGFGVLAAKNIGKLSQFVRRNRVHNS